MSWPVQSFTLVIMISISLLFIVFLIKFPNLQNGNYSPWTRHFDAISRGSNQRGPSRNFAFQVLISTKSVSYSDTSHLNTSLRKGKTHLHGRTITLCWNGSLAALELERKIDVVGTDIDITLEMIFNTTL